MKFRAMLSALLLAAGLVFITGCDSPERAFKAWKSAIAKGDVTTANKYTTANGQMVNALLAAALKDDADARKNFEKIEIVSCTKNGDRATIKFKGPDGEVKSMDMVKEGGKWKVDVKK